ncbi:MAG: hypothetical protein ACTSXZ_07510 [Alphaproteobacteria bacterium]
MTDSDLPAVTDLYCERLRGSLYARLGPRFVRNILAGIVDGPEGRALVACEGEQLHGFIAAATDVQALYQWIRRKRWPVLVGGALPGLLRRITLLGEMLETGKYFDRVGLRDVRAELLYIALRWDLQGAKLASDLLAGMLWELHESGVNEVKVTTELDNKPPQNLLWAFGFEKHETFHFYGKSMVVYVHRDLENARREPL